MISSRSSDRYRPGFADPAVDSRKAQFDRLNAIVIAGGGWITSIPGAIEVSVEVLPGSGLPDELRQLGYELEPDGEGQRILPAAITEGVITEGSTVPVRVTHPGIVKVERYSFNL
jgi:hypothetical protein